MRFLREILIAAAVAGAGTVPAEAAAPPSAADALLDQADAATRAGRKQEALGLLAKSEVLDLDSAEIGRVVRLYENLWENCRASTAGARGVRLSPNSQGAWTMYADASAYCGRRKEAMAALEKMQTLELSQELWDQAPYLYLYMGEYRKSLESSDRYVRKYPGDIWNWFRRVEAAIGAGDRVVAADALKRIEALTAADAGRDAGLEEIYALLDQRLEGRRISWILTSCPETISSRSTEAWVLSARDRERSLSLKALDQALRLRSASPESRKTIAEVFGDIARQEASRPRSRALGALLVRARAAVDRAERPESFYRLAQGFALAEQYPEAGVLFAALHDSPEDRVFREQLATWRKDKNLIGEPGWAAGEAFSAAQAGVRAGARADALILLGRAAKLNDRGAAGAIRISGLYGELGDRKALELLEPYVKAAPGDADLLIALSRAAVRLGDRDLALDSLRKAERAAADPARLRDLQKCSFRET
jgi:tetratricopeptide (TPR) repeat protein